MPECQSHNLRLCRFCARERADDGSRAKDGDPIVMTIHKITAGDGYTYLTRQVAAGDSSPERGKSAAEYYTETGNKHLYYRYFEPDDGVVGSQLFTVTSSHSFANVSGFFAQRERHLPVFYHFAILYFKNGQIEPRVA